MYHPVPVGTYLLVKTKLPEDSQLALDKIAKTYAAPSGLPTRPVGVVSVSGQITGFKKDDIVLIDTSAMVEYNPFCDNDGYMYIPLQWVLAKL